MTKRKERQATSVRGAKRKERQALEREQHGKSYEEANWAKLSPGFREAHNRLLMMQGEPPIPPPEIDLYVPPKTAEKIKQFDPTDPEFLQSAREWEGPLPEDSEDTIWWTWDDVPEEFKEWARANACGNDVLEVAKQQTRKQLRRRLIVHQEFFTLIRKIHDAYMADARPEAQPKATATAVEWSVKGLNPKAGDDSDQSAYDKWEDRNDVIRRTVYRALKKTPLWFWLEGLSSAYEDSDPFDSRVGPPLDERGAKEWFAAMQYSRQMRRKRRRMRHQQSE